MRDLEVSKELLGEVLGYEVDAFLGISENEIDYTCCRDKDIGYEDIGINIYEFAYLNLKQWAISKCFQIISGFSDEQIYRKQDEKAYAQLMYYTEDENGNGEYEELYFMANTEIEAVFKASEYILKELNENR